MSQETLYRRGIRPIKLVVLFAAAGGVYIAAAFDRPQPVGGREAIRVPAAPRERAVEELVEEIPPRYGIPSLVVGAIIKRESGGRRDALRFEPGQLSRAAKLTNDPQLRRAYATSWGLMQVMGFHAPGLSISYSELLDAETNIEAGCAILARCLERSKPGGKVDRLRAALVCFNGSPAYADAVLASVGAQLLDREL